MASWLLGMNGGGAGGAGGAITQTTDTLATITALTPGLGDQGFPNDDDRTLVDTTDGAWAYYAGPWTTTTNTLATIEALTPNLADQGFPSDDLRTLFCLADGTWSYYFAEAAATLFDIDFTSATSYDFLTDGVAGDGVHTTNGWTSTIITSAGSTTWDILNGTGYRVIGNGAAVPVHQWDPAQWGTLTERSATRTLWKMGAGSSIPTNGQQLVFAGGTTSSEPPNFTTEPGMNMLHIRAGGNPKSQGRAFLNGNVTTAQKGEALQTWYEMWVYPRSAVLYTGASAGLPDPGDLTKLATIAIDSTDNNAVWNPSNTMYQLLAFVPNSAAYTAIIERMVVQLVTVEPT